MQDYNSIHSFNRQVRRYENRQNDKGLTEGQRRFARSFVTGANDTISAYKNESTTFIKSEIERELKVKASPKDKSVSSVAAYNGYGAGTIAALHEILRKKKRK